MKAEFLKIKSNQAGISTLEILIALALITVSITSTTVVIFGNQSVSVDNQTNLEALSKAQAVLELKRSLAREDFNSVNSESWTLDTLGQPYYKEFKVNDISPCLKEVSSIYDWAVENNRSQKITLTTELSSTSTLAFLGGDCATDSFIGSWNPPKPFASYKFNSTQPVALDIFNKIAYVIDNNKNLQIVDTSSAYLNYHGDFITPAFDAGINLNDIDVAQWIDPVSGAQKNYAYVVRHENPNQFQVIDVTNINAPSSNLATMIKTLEGSNPPTGANSEGWRVFYYNNYTYVTTRKTVGYEFHIFNVTTPTNPFEVGPGYQINGTTNDFVVVKATVNGISRRIAYLATDKSTMEIMILDVTNPNNPQFLTSVDLPDKLSHPQSFPDALSIYIIGNHIYVGRQESSFAPEFYVFTISYGVNGLGNLTANLTQVGSQEMEGDVKYIIVSGKFSFLAVSAPQYEFQVWNISNPKNGKICDLLNCRIDLNIYNLANKIVGGMDYENSYIYVGVLAGDALRILYSPAQCADEIDNDGDSKIDMADPECHTDGNANNPASYNSKDDDETN